MKIGLVKLASVSLALAGWFPLQARADLKIPLEDRDPFIDKLRESMPKPVPLGTRVRAPNRVFFPPLAPVLGAELRALPNRDGEDQGPEAPDRLGDFVGEFFYPALSTRLIGQSLDDKTARRLEAYQANRRDLLNELQNTLVTVRNLEAADREKALRAFAATQNPRLAALEAEADKVRQQLIEGSLVRDSVDWSRRRDWRARALPADASASAPAAEAQVLRAAAYYQNGLTPEQRGLMVEIADDAFTAANRARPMPSNDQPASVIYFSPEMSRLPVPAVPSGLSSRIYAYVRARDALKDELRETVLTVDGTPASTRENAFSKLADAQWPRLADLVQQADAIRRELAALPPPARPPLPPQVPPALIARINALNSDRRAFDTELRAAVLRENPDASARGAGDAQTRNGARRPDAFAELQERRRQAEAKFWSENAGRAAALERASDDLKLELTTFARAHTDPATGAPMEVSAMFDYLRASDRYFDQRAREETLYRDYRIAMHEPGLSPAQRRLLFNAARVSLAQALPASEEFPDGDRP